MVKAPATIFYADLNCPFCFAMNERLLELGVEDVEWRGVEHEPDLPVPWSLDRAQQAELTDEVERVEQRAPECRPVQPPHRPNSRLAIDTVIEARRRDPVAAERLRTRIFRALWREGRDISDVAVLAGLCDEVGLPGLGVTAHARDTGARWTDEWVEGAYDRIPVLVAGDGNTLLGLSTTKAIEVFLGVGFSSETGLVCE